jgi:hypothetical protein
MNRSVRGIAGFLILQFNQEYNRHVQTLAGEDHHKRSERITQRIPSCETGQSHVTLWRIGRFGFPHRDSEAQRTATAFFANDNGLKRQRETENDKSLCFSPFSVSLAVAVAVTKEKSCRCRSLSL